MAECYITARVNGHGFIMVRENLIPHRESRGVDQWPGVVSFATRSAATKCMDNHIEAIVVGLDEEGGGAELWMKDEQKPLLTERLATWKGCYGAWPVRTMKGA